MAGVKRMIEKSAAYCVKRAAATPHFACHCRARGALCLHRAAAAPFFTLKSTCARTRYLPACKTTHCRARLLPGFLPRTRAALRHRYHILLRNAPHDGVSLPRSASFHRAAKSNAVGGV